MCLDFHPLSHCCTWMYVPFCLDTSSPVVLIYKASHPIFLSPVFIRPAASVAPRRHPYPALTQRESHDTTRSRRRTTNTQFRPKVAAVTEQKIFGLGGKDERSENTRHTRRLSILLSPVYRNQIGFQVPRSLLAVAVRREKPANLQ